MRMCIGKAKKDINRMRELRLICGFIAGKTPTELWSMPGDYDHIKLRTHQERLELARKFGVYYEWGLDKN